MTDSNSLLANYRALVQDHASRFDPEIEDLQQLVQTRMQEIRQREQALVEAQTVELQRIADALTTDARCLLSIPEFRAFVQELKQIPTERWYSQRSQLTVADDPDTWLLRTFDLPVSLSNYQTQEDPYAYDDERTHTLYSYSLTIRLGSVECQIEVPTKRCYNLNEQRESSLKDQIDYYISSDVEDLLAQIEQAQTQRSQMAQELSVLVGYASTLFALTPRTANFAYTSTGER